MRREAMRAPVLKAAVIAAAVAGLAAPAAFAAAGPDPGPVTSPRVVGGQPATEPYPFAVSLQTNRGDHFCGAALIRPNWVETAKHCVVDEAPSSMQVRVGSTNRTSGGTVARVSRIVLHPSGSSDVAVVQLATSVPYQPIQIADAVPVGSAIRLLGWGATCDPCNAPLPTILQQLDTTVLPDSRCGTGTPELCVSNVDGWRGACYGDSGGPAVIRVAGTWRLAGTTTAGTTAICGQGPSIYMDSAAHRAWIDSVVGNPPPPGRVFENGQDVPIADLSTAESPITVTGVPGNAPAALRVDVTIRHTYRGDLVLSLVAPDGSGYLLEDFPNNDSGDDVVKTYTVNASSEIPNGTWKLRVRDGARLDTGRIDIWRLQFWTGHRQVTGSNGAARDRGPSQRSTGGSHANHGRRRRHRPARGTDRTARRRGDPRNRRSGRHHGRPPHDRFPSRSGHPRRGDRRPGGGHGTRDTQRRTARPGHRAHRAGRLTRPRLGAPRRCRRRTGSGRRQGGAVRHRPRARPQQPGPPLADWPPPPGHPVRRRCQTGVPSGSSRNTRMALARAGPAASGTGAVEPATTRPPSAAPARPPTRSYARSSPYSRSQTGVPSAVRRATTTVRRVPRSTSPATATPSPPRATTARPRRSPSPVPNCRSHTSAPAESTRTTHSPAGSGPSAVRWPTATTPLWGSAASPVSSPCPVCGSGSRHRTLRSSANPMSRARPSEVVEVCVWAAATKPPPAGTATALMPSTSVSSVSQPVRSASGTQTSHPWVPPAAGSGPPDVPAASTDPSTSRVTASKPVTPAGPNTPRPVTSARASSRMRQAR